MFSAKDALAEHWKLIHKCWKHNLKEFSQGVWRATSELNPILRLICSFTVKLGSREILQRLNSILRKYENIAA
jgi:hypothetical protein